MKQFFQILGYIRPYKLSIGLNMLFNLATAAFSLVSFTAIIPFLKILFDTAEAGKSADDPVDNKILAWLNTQFEQLIIEEGPREALMVFCIVMVGLFFLRNIFRYLAMHQMAFLRNVAVRDIRNKVYHKLLRLPLSFYSEERKGQIISRMTNEVFEIEWSIMGSLEALFREPPLIILYFGTLLVISWQLTLFVIIILPIAAFIISKLGKSLKKTAKQGQRELGEVMSSVEETVGGMRIIKAFNAEEQFRERYERQNETFFRLMVKLFRKQYLSSPIGEVISTITIAVILWFGGNLVLGNEVLNGEFFILYIVIFSQLISPARALSESFVRVQRGIAASERLDEILLADEKINELPNAQTINGLQKGIEFRNVSFSYGTEPVLSDINLSVKPGETIAFVGPSGGGKSTLVDLLPRFYDINSGEVLIDGQPVQSYNVRSLRGLFGVVSQHSILFNDTIKNNLLVGKPGATDTEVREAARIANALEFIDQMPQGFETNIGEGGMKLSGGQRQRLSIARAVLKNPPVLILDEATSALDTESERLVQDALNKLMQGRTSFVIAHRLSTIQHADRIVLIEKGRIAEEGTHEELLAKSGTYSKLVSLQNFG